MNYWNRDNFEGMKSIGEKYSSIEGYELFGKYCLQKELGLKKLAVSSIKDFVDYSKKQPLKEQRTIAEELSSLGFWHGEAHQLLAHPLVEFLKEVLQCWAADEPNNPTPHKWFGYVARDTSAYERALLLNPKDDICISQIVCADFGSIDYQTHHLSESILLGCINDAKYSLEKAGRLIETLSAQDLKNTMQSELEYYAKLLNCWEEYSSLGTSEPFPDWCASKGNKFNFWSVVYYSG